MKKSGLFFLLCAGMLCFAGCKEKEPIENIPDNEAATNLTPEEGTPTPAMTVDYAQGNTTDLFWTQMMKTETGYYYYDWIEQAMRYHDNATGKTTYLCNKPECRHDGNQFCVATNNAYEPVGHYLQDGKIYVAAWENTETQCQLKLLTMALDGSELNEVITVYTQEQSGAQLGFYSPWFKMHREYAILPIYFNVMDGTQTSYVIESEFYKGTAIINLKTKEISFFDEEPISIENKEITNVTAYGDYLFYCIAGKKKTELHYYNLKEKEDKVCKLLINFKGKYAVLDEKTVLYLKSGILCSHNLETGENTEGLQKDTFRYTTYHETQLETGETVTWENEEKPDGLNVYTDGDYVYIPLKAYVSINAEAEPIASYSYLNIYDKELTLLAQVNMADEIGKLSEVEEFVVNTKYGQYFANSNNFFRYTGDVIHYEIPLPETRGYYLYRVNREELLAGTPSFEFMYQGEN